MASFWSEKRNTFNMAIREIYKSLPEDDRRTLISKIIGDGVAGSTAYAYCDGRRTPKKLYQIQIQKYIGRLTGQLYPLEELFPAKEE